MQFLVSTHGQLGLYEINTASWEVSRASRIASGYHYGIGILQDELISGETAYQSADFVVYYGGSTVHDQTMPTLRFYKLDGMTFSLVGERLLRDMKAVHQIACTARGIYIANTGRNALSFEAFDGSGREDFYIDGITDDRNHINSIYPTSQSIYSVLHNLHRIESQLVVFHHEPNTSFSLKAKLSLWDEQCHNVFLDEQYLAYNASAAGQFVVANWQTQKLVKRFRFSEHPKGLSVTSEFYIIGLSEYTTRNKRAASPGYLGVINRKTLEMEARIPLKDAVTEDAIGNINEIRCISGEEQAHHYPETIALDWEHIKLARHNPFRYVLLRLKPAALRPVRKIIKHLR